MNLTTVLMDLHNLIRYDQVMNQEQSQALISPDFGYALCNSIPSVWSGDLTLFQGSQMGSGWQWPRSMSRREVLIGLQPSECAGHTELSISKGLGPGGGFFK